MKLVSADMSGYESLVSACAAQEGASESDMKSALTFEMPTTRTEKCLNACIGEKTGIVSKVPLNCYSRQNLFHFHLL